jgi:hypothetical protein
MGIPLMLVLSDRWAEVLTSQPETGMGYQIVSIRLKDGRRIDNVTVVGGIISRLPAPVPEWFADEGSEDIVVTHGEGV